MLDPRPALHELLADLAAGTPVGVVSARFHAGVARATATGCATAASRAGVELVVLSGGVFQNRRLLGDTAERLEALGLAGARAGAAPAQRRRHRVRPGGDRGGGG